MKIEFFKKKNNFKKKTFAFNTSIYWELALFCAVVIVLSSFFFGYYLFNQINQETVLPTTNEGGQVGAVSKDSIEKVLNYFSQRETTSSQIINSPSPVVDPSL